MSRRALALLFGVFVALGCGLSQPVPQRRSFVLPEPAPVGHGPGCGVVRLHRVRAVSPFERKAVVYRIDETTYEADPTVEFFAPPGIVLRQLTGRWLSEARVFDMVLDPGDARLEDWILGGVVTSAFIDRRQDEEDRAVLEVEYTLLERRSMRPVFQRSYASVSSVREAGSLEEAWSRVLRHVLGRLEVDMRVLVTAADACAAPADETR